VNGIWIKFVVVFVLGFLGVFSGSESGSEGVLRFGVFCFGLVGVFGCSCGCVGLLLLISGISVSGELTGELLRLLWGLAVWGWKNGENDIWVVGKSVGSLACVGVCGLGDSHITMFGDGGSR
jgi:hypothetical protein